MNDNGSIWRFCLSALAVWRISHLLAEEDGPWDVIVKLRGRLGQSVLGRLMDCFYCLSLWVSLPLAIWASDGWTGVLLQWPALSGAACLLERLRAFQRLSAYPPCWRSKLLKEIDDVLRTEAKCDANCGGRRRRRGRGISETAVLRSADGEHSRAGYGAGVSVSRTQPVLLVDGRDAVSMLRTRLFRQVR